MISRPVRKAQTRVDADQAKEALLKVGLNQEIAQALKDEIPVHRFLDAFLRDEHEEREIDRMRISLRLSGLLTGQTLADFDFAFQPSIERGRIEALATCAWS